MQDSNGRPFPDGLAPLPGAVITQYITCGKPKCRCHQGHRHGPYYYRVWREGCGGRVRKVYVPKSDLAVVEARCALFKAYEEELRRLKDDLEKLSVQLRQCQREAERLLRRDEQQTKETQTKETQNKETQNKETQNKETQNKETQNKETQNKERQGKERRGSHHRLPTISLSQMTPATGRRRMGSNEE